MDFVFDQNTMNGVFKQIYEIDYWGGGSGHGSSLENTFMYNYFVRTFIEDHQDIHTVVDLGCGDWQSTYDIYDNLSRKVDYLGIDIVSSVIESNQKRFPNYEFVCDSITDVKNLPNADLFILKDVIQHWPNENLVGFMNELTSHLSKYKYILLCNCCFQKYEMQDCELGKFRPLSSRMQPLAQYNPKPMLFFSTKEICLITNRDILEKESEAEERTTCAP